MQKEIRFLVLDEGQRRVFDHLFDGFGVEVQITKDVIVQAGPIPQPMIYLVNGCAVFMDGGVNATLGEGVAFNAVVVPARHMHSWQARKGGTRVRRVAGDSFVRAIAMPDNKPPWVIPPPAEKK